MSTISSESNAIALDGSNSVDPDALAVDTIPLCEVSKWHPVPGSPNTLTQITWDGNCFFIMTDFALNEDDYVDSFQGYYGSKGTVEDRWEMKRKDDASLSKPNTNFRFEDYEACVIKRSSNNAESIRRVMQEANVMKVLKGRPTNILLPVHIWKDNKNNYYRIIPEYTLLDDMIYDIKGGRGIEKEMEIMIPDLLHGLQDLKDIKLYHRNLTIQNIAKIDGRYVILDLSMSRNAVYKDNQNFDGSLVLSGRSLCHEICLAPEVTKIRKKRFELTESFTFDGYAIDMWGLGKVLSMMEDHIFLETDEDSFQREQREVRGELLKWMTQEDPTQRCTVEQTWNSDWFQMRIDRILHYNSHDSEHI